ncbi:MAG: hypothetical protein JW966_04150 [Anaerolineae bacterium]|nr:hypothetical protein [Anaerolineae bacterium]
MSKSLLSLGLVALMAVVLTTGLIPVQTSHADDDLHDLVLITRQTVVLNMPNGDAAQGDLYPCQTAFVTEIQGGWGLVEVMGGWINLADTLNVNDAYGQENFPIMDQCAGAPFEVPDVVMY